MNTLLIVVVAAVWTAMVLAVGRILYLHETDLNSKTEERP